MFHRLVGGAVLAHADGIVGEDVDDGQFHQRAQTNSRTAVIAENKKTSAKWPYLAQRQPVQNGAHGMFADTKVKVTAVMHLTCKIPRPFKRQPRLGGWSQIGRAAQQPGHILGNGIQHLARTVAAGIPLASAGKTGKSLSQPSGSWRCCIR